MREIEKIDELWYFLDLSPSPKSIFYPYTNVSYLKPTFNNNFFYKVFVDFPINKQQWNTSYQLLLHQTLLFEYVFHITSLDDYEQAEEIIEQFQIEKYSLKPVYNGDNIDFFIENVFLTKEDILTIPMSIKDFFFKQCMNTDFGKLNILPTGDIYANLNHPALGNIYLHSIYEIVQKELDEGKSWMRIRNEAPCNTCLYQYLCPSPSDYEIAIGKPNLCRIE